MRRSKYGNVRTRGFASKAEYARWQELKLLEKADEIFDLEKQVKIPLHVHGELVCTYIADFGYWERHLGQSPVLVIEDVKGVRTDVYRLKKKLLHALKGITIREVNAKSLGVRRK